MAREADVGRRTARPRTGAAGTLAENRRYLSGAPLPALVAHFEEGAVHQGHELARLREHLATAWDKLGVTPITARALEALLTCLETEFVTHGETSGHLFSRIAELARGACDEEAPVQLRGLLRRMRAERECILGLLDYASSASASFACPPGTGTEQRDLFAVFARWDRRERAHLQAEANCLVPRALALVGGVEPMALTVHRLDVLSPGGQRRQVTVYCPAERRSVDLEWCRGCPLVGRIERDLVQCAPDLDMRGRGHTCGRLGDDASVGEVMGASQIGVSPDVPAGELANALANAPGMAALVVDDSQRLLGLVEPNEAASSPIQQRSVELGHMGPTVAESASLADAVAFMAKAHLRFLPVIRDDGRAVGVLTDLDAMRWVAAKRRPR
jgi:CBS domain-containing protein